MNPLDPAHLAAGAAAASASFQRAIAATTLPLWSATVTATEPGPQSPAIKVTFHVLGADADAARTAARRVAMADYVPAGSTIADISLTEL